MKGRYNSLVYKHRTPLQRSIIKALDEGGGGFVTECLISVRTRSSRGSSSTR